MPMVDERVDVRQAPPVRTRVRMHAWWAVGAVAVVGLIALGVWLVVSGGDSEFGVAELAAAEDAIVVAVPTREGISVQDFAAAEQMVALPAPMLIGISPAEFAAAESAVVVPIPAPKGISIDEFALLESQVGR